jgi:hypothetical protein
MQKAVLSAIVALLFLPSLGFGQAALTDQQVIDRIIQQSRDEYHDDKGRRRPCACPDDRARDGSLCGGRSAYIRPGGAEPKCYAKDVTKADIDAYRARISGR